MKLAVQEAYQQNESISLVYSILVVGLNDVAAFPKQGDIWYRERLFAACFLSIAHVHGANV